MSTYAKVIADSISPDGVRLTTMEVRFHRFVLAEMNTHRVFSRNSASSRAIPAKKQLQRVRETPAIPVTWPAEQKGMQGGAEVEDPNEAENEWRVAADEAGNHAEDLALLGVHKSIVNRLLEPFMWHTVIVTATAWDNFFAQRCHSAAQPEIRVAAEMMRDVMAASEPQDLVEGEWHLPYIEAEDWRAMSDRVGLGESMYPLATKISAARCARVSYLTQDGQRDIRADLDLYDRLTDRQKDSAHANDPIHWSPLEHVATPWAANRQAKGILYYRMDDGTRFEVNTDHLPKVGNLLGWRSLRTEVETQRGETTFT